MTIQKTDKQIKTDTAELTKLLQALYKPAAEPVTPAVFNALTASIDDTYLQARGDWLKKHLTELPVLEKLLNNIVCHKTECSTCPINKYCNEFIRQSQSDFDPTAPKFIDFFCGAGGLSLGFKQEGFLLNLANDIQECCIDTYKHNHPETPGKHILLGDINEVLDSIDAYTRFKTTDLVIGGPPCQGFSTANRQRLIDDPRNSLYKSYVSAIEKIKPKFFIMENVKGMSAVADQVVNDFNNIGYSVSYQILKAEDFGVPQHRERLIYIGNRIGADNDAIFKAIEQYSTTLPEFSLKDALFGLKPLDAAQTKNATEIDSPVSGKKFDKVYTTESNAYLRTINNNAQIPFVANHKARYNNDRDIEIFGRLFQGDRSDDPKIADIMPYKNRNHIFKDKYFKLEENKICKTITAHMKFDCNMYIHPTQARGLTPREAARIQSYPDSYYFRGPYTKTYMQIGNAVPPLLGRAIAHVIKNNLCKNS